MKWLLSSLMLTTAMATAASAQATGTAGFDEQLRVGKTNITCVQAPCPWRGISAADNPQVSPASLLWVEQTLPSLEASEEDAGRIVDAWNNDQCLLIEGRLVDSRLEVSRIVGDCP